MKANRQWLDGVHMDNLISDSARAKNMDYKRICEPNPPHRALGCLEIDCLLCDSLFSSVFCSLVSGLMVISIWNVTF